MAVAGAARALVRRRGAARWRLRRRRVAALGPAPEAPSLPRVGGAWPGRRGDSGGRARHGQLGVLQSLLPAAPADAVLQPDQLRPRVLRCLPGQRWAGRADVCGESGRDHPPSPWWRGSGWGARPQGAAEEAVTWALRCGGRARQVLRGVPFSVQAARGVVPHRQWGNTQETRGCPAGWQSWHCWNPQF